MFSFFQTIFHKVTMVIAAAAIAIGLISAPEPPKQPVLDNQNPVVVEQQVKETEGQGQKQSEVNPSFEIERLKKEVQELRKNVEKPKPAPIENNQATQQQSTPTVQPQKTDPPRPENSDDWTFNWDAWAWEKHSSAPRIAPTIVLPQQNTIQSNQPSVSQEYQRRAELENLKAQINAELQYLNGQRSQFESYYQNMIASYERQKSLELSDLERNYHVALESIGEDYAQRGLYSSGARIAAENNLSANYNSSKQQIESYYSEKINNSNAEKSGKLLNIEYQIAELNRKLQQVNQELNQ